MARHVLWQQAGNYPAQVDRALFATLWPAGGASGPVASAVNNTMTISLPPGSAAVPLQPGQAVALCTWDAAEVVTVTAAPPSGQSRVDLIAAQVRDNSIDGGPNNDFIFVVIAGTPAASNPAVPATPTNALALYNVTVPGAAANLNAAPLFDMRWPLGGGPYSAVYVGASYTTPNSAYMRLQLGAIEEDHGFWDVANRQFVVPVSGLYLVTAAAQVDRAVAFGFAQILKNGATIRSGPNANQPTTGTFSNPAFGVVGVVRANVGDRLEAGLVAGGASNVLTGAAISYAQFKYQGP